ncbi:sugar ABC transporter substrate-binding protein [Tropicimonas sp. IMCC34043]|uniref:sugar ABC transporter substrate-binding protein n=1 Tax=Tropicimonas sp. IMCC34043 TaxID=2248760 RepID=UPI000E24762D|nr:sugar ABC transporter substrate-binding protein [Tropicimonas sp. IMCC34043]
MTYFNRTALRTVSLTAMLAGAALAQPALADDMLAEAKAMVEQGYAGLYEAPPETGPAAVSGKTIWYISCGQAFVLCAQQAEGFAEAAEHLGWQVSVQDGKATPSVASDIIRQAVAAKADGIAISAFDCPGVKSALLQAKAEGVPVVSVQSIDCSADVFGSEEPLFTASVNMLGSTDARDFYYRFGELRANYVIARTEGQGKVISIAETSQQVQQINHKGFMDTIAKCEGCEVAESTFNFGQVPSPATQIWQSALLQNPDAVAVEYGIDALMELGLQTAVRQSGRTDLVVGGGEGFPNNFDLIRRGTQTFSVALPFKWFGWAVADTMNRVLAGEDPAEMPNQGTGFIFVDAEHNLPEPGEMLEPKLDFRAAYLSVWNG